MVTDQTDAVLWTPVFRVQCPETDPTILQQTKERLLQKVLSTNSQNAPVAPASDENQFKKRFSAHSVKNQAFVAAGQYPLKGRSEHACTLPVLQFLPKEFQAPLQKLGVYTLADYLLRSCSPLARRELGAICGVPPNISLLIAWRAELLDLPMKIKKGDYFHTKDILLLGVVGLDSLPALKALGELFNAHPNLQPTFVLLLEAIQKSNSNYVGRRRVTKHDITFWLKNAAAVDSLIEIEKSPEPNPTQKAEGILVGHLQQRLKNLEDFWKTIVTLALLHLRQSGAKGLAELKKVAIRDFNESDQKAVELALRHCQPTLEAYGDPDFEAFIYEDEGWSLLKDTIPQMRPNTNSVNEAFQFYLKPALSLAAMRQSDALPQWLERLTTSLKPSPQALNQSVEGS